MNSTCTENRLFTAGLACGLGLLAWAAVRHLGRKIPAEKRDSSGEKHLKSYPFDALTDSEGDPVPAVRRTAPKRLYDAAAALSFSVLADSLLEHYRGCFSNRLMFIAPVVSAVTLAESTCASIVPRRAGAPVRSGLYGAAVMTGVAGLGFHLYNVGKREGAFSWHNLFYAAPVGAPGRLPSPVCSGLPPRR